VISISPSSVL